MRFKTQKKRLIENEQYLLVSAYPKEISPPLFKALMLLAVSLSLAAQSLKALNFTAFINDRKRIKDLGKLRST
jgi:hypothetical protein